MNRKDFLKGLGLAGASTVMPFNQTTAKASEMSPPPTACTLIPSETEGPFPLDLTTNTFYFRKAVNETQTGVPLTVKLRIIGANNCLPMKNVRVNIWHCDKGGVYSGYAGGMNQGGTADSTFCRGYQFTDNDGVATFTTIFPGWYSGRVCHIHFKVTVSTSYAAVSQLTFPVATKNALYAASPALYTKGADPQSIATDNIFLDGYALQLATLTQNASGGYETFLEVTVNGTGTVGVGHAEKENAKQFTMGQNYPNPVDKQTTIPFKLINASDVTIDLYDLMGQKVARVFNEKGVLAGEQQCVVDLQKLGLASANYMYQIEVTNGDGTFKDVKMMTAVE